MNSIKDILNLCDTTVESFTGRLKEFILRNGRKINETIKLFSNEDSKYLYAQEILYCAFSQYLRADVASYFAGLMTESEFQKFIDAMKQHKIYKLFEAPEKENTDFIKSIDLTATFLIEQYTYRNLVGVEKDDICFDCGAFIGDTSIYFVERGAKKIYAFEIDHDNIKCLKTNIENFNLEQKIEVVEKAVGNSTGFIHYTPVQGNIAAGRISNDLEGVYDVMVTTVDQFCEDKGVIPNFIKFDIEGAELNALLGAENIIRTHYPKLAICIYHELSHRWEIPILLHAMAPDYKFYLKKSQPHCETVLFAIKN